MSGLTGQTTNLNTNQLSENIYCNSEAYNVIYDASYILSGLLNIQPTVDALLNTHNSYFSQYLDANIGVPTPGNEVKVPPDFNRINLTVSSFTTIRNKDLVVFVIYIKYEFEYYDASNTYISNWPYTIQNQDCEYVQSLGKNWHKFETDKIDLFHFSFHGVNNRSPRDKSVGAFHLKLDYIHPRVFRPFIIHPVRSSYQFYLFHAFSRHLFNYYTSFRSLATFNEFTTYVTRNPHKNEPFMISRFVAPIYDIVVTQVLDPLARIKLPAGTIIPIPEPDTNQGVTKTCADMMAYPGSKPKWFGGKYPRKRTRSRQTKRRKRTLKRVNW